MADVIFILVTVVFFIIACALRPRLRSSVRGHHGTGICYRLDRVGGYLGVFGLRLALAGKVLRSE